ncbi:class I SAM-dependent methyltransferase [Smaragdicoccus niigatensis]|uniref:class I SAM-dependent methyltransferase n=1 Tax=Smaragdicoccus niigatensis TaxID=359359 RepID=UPI0003A9CFFE|nr:class I SAM-dependent methyltransferase [Smaragdicoccus niigatensis]
MKAVLRRLIPAFDLVLWLPALLSALVMRVVRRIGLGRMPLVGRALSSVGVTPAVRRYYDPFFDERQAIYPLGTVRELPGIDLATERQLGLLAELDYADEFVAALANQDAHARMFSFDNDFYGAGDAELLYAMIRRLRPRTIIEVGSGNSTLIVRLALAANERDDAGYRCRHVCIEPFEARWLPETGAEVIRERVESVDRGLFDQLGPNDLLFIDSSHTIRPQGDVVVEYLEILPRLAPGVIVHIHDIFTPRDYPREWVVGRRDMWDEQYLVEAFLTHNLHWEVVLATNHLYRDHHAALARVCPYLRPGEHPSSMYLRRTS